MIEKKRVDIDNMDEFLSIELDNGMSVGDIIDIHLMPEEAYGEKDPDAIITVPISELAGSEELKVDDMVYLQNVYGQPFPAKVTALTENDITFDANHEMAGKELNFKIELVEVK